MMQIKVGVFVASMDKFFCIYQGVSMDGKIPNQIVNKSPAIIQGPDSPVPLLTSNFVSVKKLHCKHNYVGCLRHVH